MKPVVYVFLFLLALAVSPILATPIQIAVPDGFYPCDIEVSQVLIRSLEEPLAQQDVSVSCPNNCHPGDGSLVGLGFHKGVHVGVCPFPPSKGRGIDKDSFTCTACGTKVELVFFVVMVVRGELVDPVNRWYNVTFYATDQLPPEWTAWLENGCKTPTPVKQAVYIEVTKKTRLTTSWGFLKKGFGQ
jgi:hypothetical protein